MARNNRDDDRDDDRRSRGRDDDRRSRGRDEDDSRERGSRRDRDDDRGRDRGGRRGGDDDFEYAGRSKEDNAKRANQSSGRYDSILTSEVLWFSARVGENCVRVIPWLNKKFENFEKLKEKYGNHWGVDGMIHRNVGANKDTYFCLNKMAGIPCAMCDAFNEEGDERLKPSDRMFCWVIDRKDEKKGPQLWNMPLGNSKDIARASEDRRTGELMLIEHPNEGYDIYFDREGERDRTRYKQFEIAKDPTPLHENPEKMRKWFSIVLETPLPELFKVYDAEHIEKVLSGQRPDDDDDRGDRRRDRDRDDDDRSSSRRRRDDDDDRGNRRTRQDQEDDEGGEYTRPARRRGGANSDDRERDRDDARSERDSERSSGRRGAREDEDEDRPRRRGGRTEDPPTDDEPDGEDRGSGRRGGKVERHRPKRDEPEEDDNGGDGDDDRAAAKERLGRVGRRGNDR